MDKQHDAIMATIFNNICGILLLPRQTAIEFFIFVK